MNRIRQLAAIMFTDIQGYTLLMQQNEEKAIQFRDKHRQIFNAVTKKYKGKILQYYGDGTLSIFDSAIDAVNCAIEMQHDFMQDPSLPVRIGIHIGDIIFSDEEIIGDGVNIASRIESLAVPGSIFISEKVYDEIKNQESIKTSLLKTFKLKNVENPIKVYAISNSGLVVPKSEGIKGKTKTDHTFQSDFPYIQKSGKHNRIVSISILTVLIAVMLFLYLKFGTHPNQSKEAQQPSIAVLAFENMSGDPDQEYFSDGISEEILNSLAKLSDLKVAGRTSAFSFKGKHEDVRTIGRKLNVKMVLEGSVRKAGSKFRITAQLINVEDGYHIWSETYDRELEDIFVVQEDIANRIVDKLKLQVGARIKSHARIHNPEAYELCLKGSYFLKKDYADKILAMEYFKKAIELDPDYAEAYAFIGETYLQLAAYNLISAEEAYTEARKMAQKAILLDEHEPRAYKVFAYIYLFYDWDWDASIQAYQKAVQYGLPEQNEFIVYHDIFLSEDYDRANRVIKQMIDTDPFHVLNHWQLGMCNLFAGQFEEALVAYNNAIELDPNYSDGHHWKGLVLGYLGRFEEAMISLNKALEITQGEGLAYLDILAVKILMGKKSEVLPIIESQDYIDPCDAARLYTLMGMHDEAIIWLEKGYQQHSVMMVTIKHFWVWDPLRDDPRFIEIYNRMNF